MICVDSTFLGLLLHPSSKPPNHPDTGEPIERLEDRLALLIETWDEDNEKILIPTPVLSEFLILAGDEGADYLSKIHDMAHFQVASFDERAAVELAAIHIGIRAASSNRAKKRGDADAVGTWAKLKFDRQIVAIAKVNMATVIYSDDKGMATFAEQNGLAIVQTWQLPLPKAQAVLLPFEDKEVGSIAETASANVSDDSETVTLE